MDGYDTPNNATLVRVGAGAYNEAMLDIVKGMKSENEANLGKSGVAEISRLADKATMIAALEMCPDGVYPSEVKLFMNAGFDLA